MYSRNVASPPNLNWNYWFIRERGHCLLEVLFCVNLIFFFCTIQTQIEFQLDDFLLNKRIEDFMMTKRAFGVVDIKDLVKDYLSSQKVFLTSRQFPGSSRAIRGVVTLLANVLQLASKMS